MRQSEKKKRERVHVNRFCEKLANFPIGQLRDGDDRKEPDFLLGTEKGFIGIEHTEFFQDQSEKAGSSGKTQETLRRKVLWNAVRLYEKRGRPLLDVNVAWNDDIKLDAKGAKELQALVADLVADHVPDTNQVVMLEWPDDRSQSLPPEISSVRIVRFDFLAQNHWNFARSGYVPILSPCQIEQIIARKESKLANYRERCSAVWLLIVADDFNSSSFCEVTEEVQHYQFKTAFDRVFFFKYFDGTSWELKRR